jgi:heme-degrading monooxygenase HmoA
MNSSISHEDRIAGTSGQGVTGPVTLMNSFAVPAGRDDAFRALWDKTSKYFIAQPGFVSLRLHRAVSDDATYRWVNVATWQSEGAYRAAHSTEGFRRVVTQEGWQEFPSVPALYEVVTAVG